MIFFVKDVVEFEWDYNFRGYKTREIDRKGVVDKVTDTVYVCVVYM